MTPEHMSNDGYHCIGRGGCGSVWALDNALPSAPLSPQKTPCASVSSSPSFPRNQVLKRADGDPERSIANDLAMHQHLLNTTQNTYLDFLVPQSKMMLEANSPAYPRNFPPELQPCQTYVQERIPALPLSIRESLIARYCPERLREHVRKSKKDEDCLVRVYCGRRRSAAERARQKRFFTLRNHPLYIDQMEELGLDTDKLVGVLAKALATCYFTAHLDANDCEFVFGLPRRSTDNARQTVPGSLEGRSQGLEPCEQQEAVFNMVDAKGGVGEDMAVWMLDFDCVRRISMDRKGFQQAVGAFWRNDPYFPRPWAHNYSTEDRRLWEVFVEEFLCKCEVILERLMESNRQPFVQLECLRRMRLAKLWVQDMELEGRKRKIEAWIDDVAEQTEIDL